MISGVKKLRPGRYIAAISGGVDSMVLLDVLAKDSSLQIIVAHYNHGTREDNQQDEELVRDASNKLGLKLIVSKGKLGPRPSEENARNRRYSFLNDAKIKYSAKAIVTAHHRDDMLETALINLLRGTNRRGLTSISSNPDIMRPFIGVTKHQILRYAKAQNVIWRDDSTNNDKSYLRNYLRSGVISKMAEEQKREFTDNLQKVALLNKKLDSEIATMSHSIGNIDSFDRASFNNLPIEIGNELLAYWLRLAGFRNFNKIMINRLNLTIKTSRAGSKLDVGGGLELHLKSQSAALILNS